MARFGIRRTMIVYIAGLVFRRIKESPVKNLFFLTQLMSFLLASFPLHRHRKSNSRWRRPLAHLPRLFLFAWTFSATFCGPWASLIDLVRISKISHDCTLTPTSNLNAVMVNQTIILRLLTWELWLRTCRKRCIQENYLPPSRQFVPVPC